MKRIGVFTQINVDDHEKVTELCKKSKVSLKYLAEELLRWAGEHDAKELVSLGINLPIWLEDTK